MILEKLSRIPVSKNSDKMWQFFFQQNVTVDLWFVILSIISSVQFSRVRLFAAPWTTALQASLSITNSWSLPKLMSVELVMPSSHLIFCLPLLLLPLIPPSRVFSNESALRMRWPVYWSFSLSIIPSKEHPGLISFRMDWLDLLQTNMPTYKSTLKNMILNLIAKLQ